MKLIKLNISAFIMLFSVHAFAQNGDSVPRVPNSAESTNLSVVRQQLSKHSQNIKNLRANFRALEERFGLIQSKPLTAPIEDDSRKFMAEPLAYPLDSVPEEPDWTLSPIQKEPSSELENIDTQEPVSQKRRIGFYILPFIALQGSSGLDYMHPTLKSSMEHELGFASGWRIGAETERLFVEGEFFYNRNELKGTAELTNGIPGFSTLSSVGESESFGFMVNAGAKFSLSSTTELLLGAGFGGMNQEIGFVLAGFPMPESEKTVFANQLFGGVDYQLAEHFRMGLRYRWMRIAKMDLFDHRDLHLAELSLGYVF